MNKNKEVLNYHIETLLIKIIFSYAKDIGYRIARIKNSNFEFNHLMGDRSNAFYFKTMLSSVFDDIEFTDSNSIYITAPLYRKALGYVFGTSTSQPKTIDLCCDFDTINPFSFWADLYENIYHVRNQAINNLQEASKGDYKNYYFKFDHSYISDDMYVTGFKIKKNQHKILSYYSNNLDFTPDNIYKINRLFCHAGINIKSEMIDEDIQIAMSFKTNYNLEKLIEMLKSPDTFELASESLKEKRINVVIENQN